MDQNSDLTAEKIKELRAKYKLSQEALAKLLGVSTSTVIRWEQGTANRPTGTAATILMAMVAGPLTLPLGVAAVAAAPWTLAAYGIYRVLRDVFEPSGPKNLDESSPVKT